MNKILIITVHSPNNIGNRLQAFALKNFLSVSGFESIIIRLERYGFIEKVKIAFLRYAAMIYDGFIFNRIKTKILSSFIHESPISQKKLLNDFNKNLDEKVVDENFLKSHYNSHVIIGSDVIWNLYTQHSLKFLFGGYFKKKMSYAASFGRENISSLRYKLIKSYLDDINKVTLREIPTSFKKMNNIYFALDPTLLLPKSFWIQQEISNGLSNKEYILVHSISKSNKFIIKKLKESNLRKYDVEIIKEGTDPRNFLNFVRKAKFVISDSYHTCIFCIIYNIPFISVPRLKFLKESSYRIVFLLEKLNHSEYFDPSFFNKKTLLFDLDKPNIYTDKKMKKLIDASKLHIYDFLENS